MNCITKEAYEGDLVSRLKNWRGLHLAHGGQLFEEAAAEIERLRHDLDACQAELGCYQQITDEHLMIISTLVGATEAVA